MDDKKDTLPVTLSREDLVRSRLHFLKLRSISSPGKEYFNDCFSLVFLIDDINPADFHTSMARFNVIAYLLVPFEVTSGLIRAVCITIGRQQLIWMSMHVNQYVQKDKDVYVYVDCFTDDEVFLSKFGTSKAIKHGTYLSNDVRRENIQKQKEAKKNKNMLSVTKNITVSQGLSNGRYLECTSEVEAMRLAQGYCIVYYNGYVYLKIEGDSYVNRFKVSF